MDSPSSIEVPRPEGKEFYTPCYIARKQARHLEDNRGKSRASGTRKETSERGRVTRECHALGDARARVNRAQVFCRSSNCSSLEIKSLFTSHFSPDR